LQTFWNEEGYMSETTITDVEKGGRSGKGAVPVSVAVLNFDPSLGCDSMTFQPCSDRALSSLKVLGDAFKDIFPITKHLSPDQPSALLGAFYEEQVFGGHVSCHFFCLILSISASFSGPLFRDLTRRGANIRRPYDMGSTRRTPNHKPLSQVLPTVRPGCQNWDVQEGF
jgi:hypothetical protein